MLYCIAFKCSHACMHTPNVCVILNFVAAHIVLLYFVLYETKIIIKLCFHTYFIKLIYENLNLFLKLLIINTN